MIPAQITSALLNHLWQSTLVAAVAALLALLLKRNGAQARYRLWLAASVKFLIPFGLLVTMGSRFSLPVAMTVARPELSVAVEQISQSFTPLQSHTGVTGAQRPVPEGSWSMILAAVWLCGFVVVLGRWQMNWRRIRAVVRAASPVPLAVGVPVFSTSSALEPGVFGIWRPVLMLPQGIIEHFEPAQLETILLHELCHVRRRDNFAAAIHMLVEAIFWFHPLVWWLGTRLVEERERACDEEVLRRGREPQVYAESILKTCRFYLESPLTCVSGVTGSDLKKRIVRIMTHRAVQKLGLGRKLLLAAVAMTTIAGPIVIGLMNAPQSLAQSGVQSETSNVKRPSFEVASIKPAKAGSSGMFIRNLPGGRISVMNMPIKELMTFAYNVETFQLSGGPTWLGSDRYDIEAKPESSSSDDSGKPDLDFQRQRERLQTLLESRCKLTFHRETKEFPVYGLVVAKNGPKLQPAGEKDGKRGSNMRKMMGRGQLTGQQISLAQLAEVLSRQLGRVVLDKTGLKGNYDFTLKWTPDQNQPDPFGGGPGPGPMGKNMPPPPDPNGPSIFTAVQEQLGLKLESQKGPVEILVIDHVEKPSEN